MFTRSGPSYSSMTMTEPRTIEGTGLSLLIDADTEGVTIRLPHGVKLDGPLATALVRLLARLRAEGTPVSIDCEPVVRQQLQIMGWSPSPR